MREAIRYVHVATTIAYETGDVGATAVTVDVGENADASRRERISMSGAVSEPTIVAWRMYKMPNDDDDVGGG